MAPLAESRKFTNDLEQDGSTQEKRHLAVAPKMENLTTTERLQIKRGHLSIPDLLRNRDEYERQANVELDSLHRTTTFDNKELILEEEKKAFEAEIEETSKLGSAEKMERLFDKIKKFSKAKFNKKEENETNAEKELDPEAPQLLKLQKEYADKVNKNTDLLGTNQVRLFNEWFENKKREKPTIKHLKKEINAFDIKILPKRKEVFKELSQVFRKNGLGSPLNSKFIKREGLSERKALLDGAKKVDKRLGSTNDSFWSTKARRKTMQDVLLTDVPKEEISKAIEEKDANIKEIGEIESKGFSYFKETIKIGGNNVRMMSDASIAYYLQGIRDEGNLQKRKNYITANGKSKNGIINTIKNEGNLAKDLEKIYKNDPEGLKKALNPFSKLDYLEKLDALKNHETLVKQNSKKTLEKFNENLNNAISEIETARGEKTLSNKVAKEFRIWASDTKKFTNEKTKELDTKKQEEFYSKMTDKTPVFDKENRNISAYKVRQEKFLKLYDKHSKNNPNVTETELKKLKNDYDQGSYSERKRIYLNLKKEVKKNEESKIDKKLENLGPKEAIEETQKLMNKGENQKAFNFISDFYKNQTSEENEGSLTKEEEKLIRFWIKTTLEKIDTMGKSEKPETSTDATKDEKRGKELEKKMEKTAKSDESIKDDLEEQRIITHNIEGVEQSEQRHQRKKSAQDRALKESISKTETQEEREVTKEFYEETETHILNEEKTGEEIERIKLDIDMTDEERQHHKDRLRKKQERLTKKEGFVDIEFEDKSGENLSSDEAKNQQERGLTNVRDELVEKSTDENATIFNLNNKLAKKRKAEEIAEKIIDEERHKTVERAA